jgi:hypothetical protein
VKQAGEIGIMMNEGCQKEILVLKRVRTWWRGPKGRQVRPTVEATKLPQCEAVIRTDSESGDARVHGGSPRSEKIENLERLLEYLAMVGITRTDFEEKREETRRSETAPISDKALAWKLLGDLLADEKTQLDFRLTRGVFHAMAWFKFGHREDCRKEVERREHMNLLDLRRTGFKRVRVHPHCRCRRCAKVNRREITIEEAMEEKPLPVRDCDRGRAVLCHYRGICEPGQAS